jgi:hypothetical protein
MRRPVPRKQQPPPPSSWDIYLARHTPAKWIRTVEATDADAAIEEAVKELGIEWRRLIAVSGPSPSGRK